MKKFFAYIKHLWKDPVNSIAEIEERKKQLKPFLWGGIAAAIASSLLTLVQVTAISTIGSLLSFLALIVVVASGFLLWVMNKGKKKYEMLTCDECHELIRYTEADYKNYVSFSVVDKSFNVNASARNTDKGAVVEAKGEEYTTAEVTIRCPKCNTVKKFRYSVRTFNCVVSETVPPIRATDVKYRLIEATQNLYDTKYDSISVTKTEPGKITLSEKVNGITIKYKRTIEDLIEGYFAKNELNGTLTKL